MRPRLSFSSTRRQTTCLVDNLYELRLSGVNLEGKAGKAFAGRSGRLAASLDTYVDPSWLRFEASGWCERRCPPLVCKNPRYYATICAWPSVLPDESSTRGLDVLALSRHGIPRCFTRLAQ